MSKEDSHLLKKWCPLKGFSKTMQGLLKQYDSNGTLARAFERKINQMLKESYADNEEYSTINANLPGFSLTTYPNGSVAFFENKRKVGKRIKLRNNITRNKLQAQAIPGASCQNNSTAMDSLYKKIVYSGQGFYSLGMSRYRGEVKIAYYDGLWHVFIDKRCQFSHADKAEVEKLYTPEVIDAELQQVDNEMAEQEIERFLAEERAELEAEQEAREHRVYDGHGYSYRVYYDDAYYDTVYHNYDYD